MISRAEFCSHLCRLGAGSPRPFPRKLRDREILIKSFQMELDSTRVYSESAINAQLLRWLREIVPAIETDHVTVRRLLVDFGYLERTADGSRYRVGFPVQPVAFALDVDDLDQRAAVAAHRDTEQRRRAERRHRGRPSSS